MKDDLAMLIIGIVLALGGALWLWRAILKKRKCSVEAEAEITGINRHGKTSTKKNADFSPVVTFNADGKEYSGEADISTVIRTKYKTGESLTIKYNPDDPNVFTVKGKAGEIKYSVGLIVFGIIMIVVFLI